MKRLFFAVPSLEIANTITHELVQIGLNKNDVHITGGVGNEIKRSKVPEATIVQTSDAIPAIKRGAIIGLVFSGILYGIFAFFLPPDIKITPTAIAAMIFVSIVLGAWMSSLIGVSVKNRVIETHEESIREGYLIMMIDCPDEKEEKIVNLIAQHHPDVRVAGVTMSSGAFGTQEKQ